MIVLDLSQEQLAAVSTNSANAVGTNNILSDIIQASGIVADEETEILPDNVAEEATPDFCIKETETTGSNEMKKNAPSTPDLCSIDAESSTRLATKYGSVNASSNQKADENDDIGNNSTSIARPQLTHHKQRLDDSHGKRNLIYMLANSSHNF